MTLIIAALRGAVRVVARFPFLFGDNEMAEESNTTTEAAETTTVGDTEPTTEVLETQADSVTSVDDGGDVPVEESAQTESTEAQPGEEAESAEAEAVPVVSLSDDAKARAAKFGITDEFIERMGIGSEDGLDLAIATLAQVAQKLSRPQEAQPENKQETEQPAQQTQPQAPVQSGEWFNLELPELDDEIAAKFTQHNEFLKGQFERVNAMPREVLQTVDTVLTPILSNLAAQIEEINSERLDSFIESLGADWEEVYGKGATADMDHGSEQFMNRMKMLNTGAAMDQGRRLTGASGLRFREQLAKGHNVLFSDKAAQKAATSEKQKIAAQLAKNGKRMIQRPNGVRSVAKELDFGEERAVQGLLEKYPEQFEENE
jgi:hypothetical protein